MAGVRVTSSLRAAGSEALGLLVEDWTLAIGIVVALGVAGLLAAATSGDRVVVGVALFAGLWGALFASLARAAARHRRARTDHGVGA